jgi:ribosomal protein L37AE/L43A
MVVVAPDDDPPSLSPQEFDRMMDEKVLRHGSRGDRPCPKCHGTGFRMIADSEMVALWACRLCGHQEEEIHEPREPTGPAFREYREGRGLIATYQDSQEKDG